MISPSLEQNPSLDDWIEIASDGTVTLRTGKAELGQGLKGAIARIGAEELDVSLERIRVETADTARGPNEGLTAGSRSMPDSGRAMRQAA
ncbi:MAG TPA: molybdopterin cofactor-binding domain-containing protein, partial [Solirubrobacteraceae bacterium]